MLPCRPAPATPLFDALLKTDQALVREAKHVAQATNKVFRLVQLVARVGKLFGKVVGAAQDVGVVKGDWHARALFVDCQTIMHLAIERTQKQAQKRAQGRAQKRPIARSTGRPGVDGGVSQQRAGLQQGWFRALDGRASPLLGGFAQSHR